MSNFAKKGRLIICPMTSQTFPAIFPIFVHKMTCFLKNIFTFWKHHFTAVLYMPLTYPPPSLKVGESNSFKFPILFLYLKYKYNIARQGGGGGLPP